MNICLISDRQIYKFVLNYEMNLKYIKKLCYKIFKESCEFSFLLIRSPDLYFSSFAEGPESNPRCPQSPFKYFAVFT